MKARKAQIQDAPAIEKLVNSAYRGDYAKLGWTSEAGLLGGLRITVAELEEMMAKEGHRFELFEDADRLVGSVFLRREGAVCYIGMVTVEPSLQARGTGKEILRRAEEIAREWGCTRCRMFVIDRREELLEYYSRRGYRSSGLVEPFKAGGSRPTLFLQGPLNFVELVKDLTSS